MPRSPLALDVSSMAAATPASPAASTASGPVASAEAKPYDAIVRRCHPSAHYDIDRRALGKGSFGTVFQGVDKSSGLTVALKFSHNHLKEPAMKGARDEAVAMQEVSIGRPAQQCASALGPGPLPLVRTRLPLPPRGDHRVGWLEVVLADLVDARKGAARIQAGSRGGAK